MKLFTRLIVISFCFILGAGSLQAANYTESWYRTELATGTPIKEGNKWQDSGDYFADFENEQWPDAAVYLIRHIRHNVSEGYLYGYDGVSGEGGNYHFYGLYNLLYHAKRLMGYTIPAGYTFPTSMNEFDGPLPRTDVPLTLDDIMPRWIKSNQFAENALFLTMPDGRDCGVHDSGTSAATDPTDPWEWESTGWSGYGHGPRPWEMDRLAHSYLLGSFGQIGLAGGPLSGGTNQTQAMLHFSRRNGHAAADCLAAALFGRGRSLFGYTGYHGSQGTVGSWHGPSNKNLVMINEGWQNKYLESGGGWNHNAGHVEICAFMPGVQVSRVDGSHIYHGGSYTPNHGEVLPDRYRRTMMLNTADPDRAYLVDIFEVDGGSTHDYIFAGSIIRTNSIPTTDLNVTQSTAFPYSATSADWNWNKYDLNRLSSGAYAADKGFYVDTGFADNPNVGALIHVPPQGETGTLYLGWMNDEGFYTKVAANNGAGRWHMMLHREGTDVKSTFMTVHEVKDGSGTSFIQSIDRTPIGTDAIAITVTLTDGREDTYLVSFDGRKTMAHNGVNAEATIAVSSRYGNRSDLWMINGTALSDANKSLTEPIGEITGNITQVNRTLFGLGSSDSFETDAVFPVGNVLRGQTLLVEMSENSQIKFVNSYTIERIEALASGSRIHLRTDPGLIISGSSVLEGHYPDRTATSAQLRFVPMATSVPYLAAIDPDPEAWKRIHVKKSVSAGDSGDVELTTLPADADVKWHIGTADGVVKNMFSIDGIAEVEFEVPNPDGLTKSRNIKKRFHTVFPALPGTLDANKPGLVALPYTGSWNKSFDPSASFNTYNFSGASQVISGFEEGQLSLSQNNGALINGYIDIPTTGLYSFYTRFDSGAQLKIDGEILTAQLGMRSLASWKSSIYLEQGPHSIEVDTMSLNFDVNMQLYWEGPGVVYQPLPPARLFQELDQTNPSYALRYSAGAGGSLQGVLSQSVVSGDDGTTVSAIASNGYHFVCWSDGELSDARTDQSVTNHLLTKALFAADTAHTITASAGAHGTVTPSGAISLPSGTNQTFTFTPSSGYEIEGVFVDGVPIGTPASYTFSNLNSDHTISVLFDLPSIGEALLLDIYGNGTSGDPASSADWSNAGIVEDVTDAAAGNFGSSTRYNIDHLTLTGVGNQGGSSMFTDSAILNGYQYTKTSVKSVSLGGFVDGAGVANTLTTGNYAGLDGNTFTLQANQDYKLYLFGAGDADNQNTTFVFGGESKTTAASIVGTDSSAGHVVSFEFTTGADLTGFTLDFTYENDASDYGAFNGLALVAMNDPPDSDGDGLTDAQELALGTDPNDPDSGFGIDSSPLPSTGKIQIMWPSATGVLYRVWESPNLADWTVARDWAAASTPPDDMLELDLSPSNGFFRVEADIQ